MKNKETEIVLRVTPKTKAFAIIGAAIILIGAMLGLLYWRNNLMIQIDTSANYVMGEADLTDFVNFSIISETFILGGVFTFLGAMIGAFADICLVILYEIIVGIIRFIKFLRYLAGKADEKYVEERRAKDGKHDKSKKNKDKEEEPAESEDSEQKDDSAEEDKKTDPKSKIKRK